jgi:hypothetical protein
MALLLKWAEENWFSLLQSLGIVTGFIFTGLSLRRDAKSRRRTEVLALAQQHRDLLSDLHRRPELSRIFYPEVDLLGKPITIAEQEFLNLVILHYNSGWQLTTEGGLVDRKTLASDVRGFFVLPLPRRAWENTKNYRDRKFVAFVEKCLAEKRNTSS